METCHEPEKGSLDLHSHVRLVERITIQLLNDQFQIMNCRNIFDCLEISFEIFKSPRPPGNSCLIMSFRPSLSSLFRNHVTFHQEENRCRYCPYRKSIPKLRCRNHRESNWLDWA